jgi:hypothetical protein
MTTTPKSLAVHRTPDTGTRLTTLDPRAGYVTLINTYVVASERAEELLDFLVRSTLDTIRHVPGLSLPTST